MKIHKLEIQNVRGIRHLKIEPNGKSFVIYGSNGSGKSAVIDALDFLLKGNIDRLVGKGTDGISLKEHGPHINTTQSPETVIVQADISINGSDEMITIRRNMKDLELEYEPQYDSVLLPLIDRLQRGQHVFTRREILKLIASPSKDRNDEILRILKLDRVEEIRAILVKAKTGINKEVRDITPVVANHKRSINSITGEPNYNASEALIFVNGLRKILGVAELNELKSEKLFDGIEKVKKDQVNIDHDELDRRFQELKDACNQELSEELSQALHSLDETIKEIQIDEQATRDNQRFDLTKQGIRLIEDDGDCPLCDTEWEPGTLQTYLEARVEKLMVRQTNISKSSESSSLLLSDLISAINELASFLSTVVKTDKYKENEKLKENSGKIKLWKDSLQSSIDAIKNKNKDLFEKGITPEKINSLFNSSDKIDRIEEIVTTVKSLFPQASEREKALSGLTRIQERLVALEQAEVKHKELLIRQNKINLLEENYTQTKDECLDTLYENVKDNFVKLYREMHGSDESAFEAKFQPSKAGVKFSVDFYGKGFHPPHAMHSEGHQDSMGVCLFLAFSHYLNEGIIDLSILDDVVMSVDSGHRSSFCDVLKNNFASKQFIITTHDTTWANQLQKKGVVGSKQMLKLYNWTVDNGPVANYASDMWKKIQADIDNSEVNEAAAKLRRGLEEWARMVCGNLRASVPYSPGDNGGFADFMNAALSKYRSFLKEAKKSANSWGNKELVEEFSEKESLFTQLQGRIKQEEWIVNPAVHFNSWENFTQDEFQNVFDAFRDMCDFFSCENKECETVISPDNAYSPSSIRCGCGSINWNLVIK